MANTTLDDLKKKVAEIKSKSEVTLAERQQQINEAEQLVKQSDVVIKVKLNQLAEKTKHIGVLKAQEIMLNNYRLTKLRKTLRQRQRIKKR